MLTSRESGRDLGRRAHVDRDDRTDVRGTHVGGGGRDHSARAFADRRACLHRHGARPARGHESSDDRISIRALLPRRSWRYVRKGPPPLLLRVLGPFVVVLTVAVLASGIVAAINGPETRWLFVHKATFVLWFGVMTVHVLGHIVETGRLAFADFSQRSRLSGAATRVTLLVIVLATGVVLGLATRGWTDAWHQLARF